MNKKTYIDEETFESCEGFCSGELDYLDDELDEEKTYYYYINVYLDEYRSLFSEVICKRGEDYYSKGNVKELTKKEDNYIAKVSGTKDYEVEVLIEDDVIKGIKCSCSYFGGYYSPCKHIYAVLKKIANEEYNEVYLEPCACPNCKSNENVIPIHYGKLTKIFKNKIKDNLVIYGGEKRETKVFDPYFYFKKWHCRKCKLDILNTGDLSIPIAFEYIGKDVKVVIDRKLGSKHPKWGFIYPINYGYIPNTISGDNEELDAYVLGQFDPLEEFDGKCIAVIHRLDDNDDKLVVVGKDKDYLDSQIEALTEFQERFFRSIIIR